MSSKDYVSDTCGQVYTKIGKMSFEKYLPDLQEAIFDPSEIVKVFEQIAQDAGGIAQEHGASVIRDAFEGYIDEKADEIHDLENRIEELGDE